MYQKSDSYDAEAVAPVLINMLDRLPDAIPDDKYWTLSQLVNRRKKQWKKLFETRMPEPRQTERFFQKGGGKGAKDMRVQCQCQGEGK